MKGLPFEQIDRMLKETTPRKSSKRKPHSTFAKDIGMTGEGIVQETGENVEQVYAPEKLE